MSGETKLELKFLGALVEQLGAQMYPSATATIAELISNAWDADARNVWVEMPFGEPWTEDSRIVVLDDGHGITYREADEAYLVVGRKRRKEGNTDQSRGGRPLHGRKGIGKLAAFGTAKILECYTVPKEEPQAGPTSFRLDYDAIRANPLGENYQAEPAEGTDPLVSPGGKRMPHGTRITLTGLKLRRAIPERRFRESMSRRFALDSAEMRIFLNGDPIERFDYPVQFHLPRDRVSRPELQVDDDWAVEELTDGGRVSWWIGFTEKPLEEESHRGISVIARGKMAQRPFLFQRAQGVSGQLGQEYLVGEVRADWLDEGLDIDEDRIQANRDQLRLEDPSLDEFLKWGRGLIVWALAERGKLRAKKVTDEIKNADEIKELLRPFTKDQRKALMRIPVALSKTEMSSNDILGVMGSVVDARDDQVVRQMWEDIDKEAPDAQAEVWKVIHRFGLIDARRNQTIIEARLKAIDELRGYIEDGAREVPTIHEHVKKNTWLLDPRWYLLGDEVRLEDLGIHYEPQEDSSGRLDYLFALRPSKPSTLDEVLVVEIKRARTADGRVRKVNEDELHKFRRYVRSAWNRYRRDRHPPAVSGIMIAEDYTQGARDAIDFETNEHVRMHFRTWGRVISETERLHRGWLAVATKRAKGEGFAR